MHLYLVRKNLSAKNRPHNFVRISGARRKGSGARREKKNYHKERAKRSGSKITYKELKNKSLPQSTSEASSTLKKTSFWRSCAPHNRASREIVTMT